MSQVNEKQIAILDSEFYFSPGAQTAAHARQIGFDRFTAVEKASSTVETDIKKKKLPRRGAMLEVKTTNRGMGIKYGLTLAEVGASSLPFMYFADPNYDWGAERKDNTQVALSAVQGAPFNFDIGNGGNEYLHNRWHEVYDAAGNRVTHLEALTLVGGNAVYGAAQDGVALEEGIDFEVDLLSGRFRISRSITDDVITPTITSKAITQSSDAYLQRLSVYSNPTFRGIASLELYDDDGEFLRHDLFRAEVHVTEGFSVSEDYATIGVEVCALDVCERSSIYVRPNVDFLDNNVIR